jgi:hypothetical protein
MFAQQVLSQNLMVGDGFGGRLWYKPYNYTTGSYSAYTICGEEKQLYSVCLTLNIILQVI